MKKIIFLMLIGYISMISACFSGGSSSSNNPSVPVAGVTLNKTSTSVSKGATEQLTASITPSNADNKSMTWTSSDTSIATVSSTGLVTGVAVGTSTITVTTADGNKTSTCAVTVVDISGTWDLIWDGDNTDVDKVILSQSGNSVSFVYGQGWLGMNVTSSVNGNSFTMTLEGIDNGTPWTMTQTGTISGDSITGTYSVNDGSTGTFAMNRISASIVVPTATIPTANITVDGNETDWASVSNFIVDATGDSTTAGTDLEFVKAAVNNGKSKMYVLMKMNNGNVNTAYNYEITFNYTNFSKTVYCLWNTGSWNVYGIDESGGGTAVNITGLNGQVASSGQYLEFSFDLLPFNLPTQFEIDIPIFANGGGNSVDEAGFFGYVNRP